MGKQVSQSTIGPIQDIRMNVMMVAIIKTRAAVINGIVGSAHVEIMLHSGLSVSLVKNGTVP